MFFFSVEKVGVNVKTPEGIAQFTLYTAYRRSNQVFEQFYECNEYEWDCIVVLKKILEKIGKFFLVLTMRQQFQLLNIVVFTFKTTSNILSIFQRKLNKTVIELLFSAIQ